MSDTTKGAIMLVVAIVLIAFVVYVVPAQFRECREHGFSVRYCMMSVMR